MKMRTGLPVLVLAAFPGFIVPFSTAYADDAATGIVCIAPHGEHPIYGEIGRENDTHVEVFDLTTGKGRIFEKSALRSIRKGVSEKAAIAAVGLPAIMAWKVKQALPPNSASGKIARLDGAVIYVTLGANHGIALGQELVVFRGNEVIKDPDSGEAIGKRKRRIAKVQTVEVRDAFCKVKMLGDLETRLEIGDVVEPAAVNNAVAVLPVVDAEGNGTVGAKRLAEALTTALVNRGVSVVERRLLDKVLGELGLQRGLEFDPTKIQAVGRQVGAYGIVAGTFAPKERRIETQLRLIKVDSGEILVALSHSQRDVGEFTADGAEAPDAGFRPLFDGESLNGWQGDPRYWSVKDGAIVGFQPGHVEGGTFLATKASYSDFALKLRFRIVEGNTGVQFRSTVLPGFRMSGYQADLAYSEGFKFMGWLFGEQMGGRIATPSQAQQQALIAAIDEDGWNECIIIAQANRIVIKINGVEAINTTHSGPTSGLIGFQLHGGVPTQVAFRDVMIRDLSKN